MELLPSSLSATTNVLTLELYGSQSLNVDNIKKERTCFAQLKIVHKKTRT